MNDNMLHPVEIPPRRTLSEQESKARWPHHSWKVHAEMRRRLENPCAITASALDTTRVIAPFVEISRKHLEEILTLREVKSIQPSQWKSQWTYIP